MRRWHVGLLVLPGVMGVSATLRMPLASARSDESTVSGGVHAAARLTRWMAGTFEAPAHRSNHGTVPASLLRSCVVSVPWLGDRVVYSQRAFRLSDGSVGRPFEQRLYTVDPSGSHATVRVREYSLVDPEAVRNLCDDPARSVAPGTVEEREGCALRLHTVGLTLRGGTDGDHCPSSINGSDHSIRTLEVTPGAISLEDQGEDTDGHITWGGHGATRYHRVSTP